MRVLLTTSPAPYKSPFFCNEKRFPLGLGFLMSILKDAGHEVFFIDTFLSPRKFWKEGFLEKNRIDYVGIYSSTICYKGTKEIIDGCDKQRKLGKWSGKIIVGGPHTSVATSPLPESVDYIVRGEGEHAILEIVEGRQTPGTIVGEPIKNLDALPRPAYDIFVSHRPPYDTTVNCFKDHPVFTMNTSRGCPFSCKFCSVQGVWGNKYRLMSAERIVEDVEWLMKDFDVRGVYFREDNFTASLKRVRRFCDLLLQKDLNIKWLCESRVKPLPKEILALMAKAGCHWLYLGCESGSQRVLNLINKQISVQDIRNVIDWSKKLGIKCYTSWIIGVPGETDEDRKKTFDLIDELKPFSAGIHVYIGLQGSEFYNELVSSKDYVYKDELGLLYSKDWNRLAVRIPSYLNENKFCPIQSVPFKIYKNLMRTLILANKNLPLAKRFLKMLSNFPTIKDLQVAINRYL